MSRIRNAGRLAADYLTVLAVYAHGAVMSVIAQCRPRKRQP